MITGTIKVTYCKCDQLRGILKDDLRKQKKPLQQRMDCKLVLQPGKLPCNECATKLHPDHLRAAAAP